MEKQTSLNELKNHLFDVLERLKCHDEPGVDPADTISLETASEIVKVSKVIVDCARVKIAALRMLAEQENPVPYVLDEGLVQMPERKKLEL